MPLMRVSAGQYEIIGLNESGKHVYTKLSNERIFQGLHKALRNYHSRSGVTDADRALAEEALRAYGKLQMDSDVMRCKLSSILLMLIRYWGIGKRGVSWKLFPAPSCLC